MCNPPRLLPDASHLYSSDKLHVRCHLMSHYILNVSTSNSYFLPIAFVSTVSKLIYNFFPLTFFPILHKHLTCNSASHTFQNGKTLRCHRFGFLFDFLTNIECVSMTKLGKQLSSYLHRWKVLLICARVVIKQVHLAQIKFIVTRLLI